MAAGYVLTMGVLAAGLLIVHRGGSAEGRERRQAAGGGIRWRQLTVHMIRTFTGGYLVLMAAIIAYYFGLVRIRGHFLESAFSGCAELLGIAAPVFLALSWLERRWLLRSRSR